jgi:DNA replication protein DnaC
MVVDLVKVAQEMSDAVVARYFEKRHRSGSWQWYENNSRKIMMQRAENLRTDDPLGLLLLGPIGSGKTSALALVVQHHVQKRLSQATQITKHWAERTDDKDWARAAARYHNFGLTVFTHGEFVTALRAHKETHKHATSYPIELRAPIVIIDDLGRGFEDQGDWNMYLQDEWFDWRWRAGLPLLITSNKTDEPGPRCIRSWLGWERIVDRICDPAFMTTVVINNESRRRRSFYEKGK